MKRIARLLCALLVLGGTLACQSKMVPPQDVKGKTKRQFKLTDLTADEVFKKIQTRDQPETDDEDETREIIILDVRDEKEYNEGHIPGAIWIPWTKLRTRHAELDKNKLIIVYCHSGNRSKIGSSILIHNGFDHVVELSGGILDWQKSNYPLIKGMSPYGAQTQH